MSNKQQTAVEWLENQLLKQKSILKNHFEEGKWNDDRCDEIDNCLLFIQQAKEMEKQKMIEFGIMIQNNALMSYRILSPEQYYKETYGDNK